MWTKKNKSVVGPRWIDADVSQLKNAETQYLIILNLCSVLHFNFVLRLIDLYVIVFYQCSY